MERDSKFAIHEAARQGQTDIVESLLNANPRLAQVRDDDNRLPIHWAVSYNHLPIVELLVANKFFDVDAQDGCGWTLLMIAASIKDSDEIFDLLLRKDADVKMTNDNGQTALHFCASKNNLDFARKLIAQGASTRIRDKRGQLPLHRAAAIGASPMCQLFLNNKSPLDTADISGQTALHHAIAEGNGETAVLLMKSGADLTKRDVDGNLAINLAPDEKVRQYVLQSAAREGIEMP